MEYADWGACGVYGESWHIIFAPLSSLCVPTKKPTAP